MKDVKILQSTIETGRLLIIGNGYIGSFLFPRLEGDGWNCDIVSRNIDPLNPKQRVLQYQSLTSAELAKYEAVLWFAGHSSVPASVEDPIGAVYNNVLDLVGLANKISPETKFIYASSASIYSGLDQDLLAATSDGVLLSQNPYDATKKSFDLLISSLKTNFFGLRMGTLSGWSPKLREELIFNAMNLSAMRHKRVTVTNKKNYRTILFLEDLIKIIYSILEAKDPLPSRFINAGSVNASIGQIAECIAEFHEVELVDKGNTGSYSFRMELDDNQTNTVDTTLYIKNQCANFKKWFEK